MLVRSLDFGTVFKIVFWAGACVWVLIALVIMVFAIIAPQSVTVNGAQSQSTAQALVAVPIALVLGAFVSAVFAAAGAG
ncbi:MAG: hypothetical protein WDN76_12895 [Alphaproteobacteria bacterium]